MESTMSRFCERRDARSAHKRERGWRGSPGNELARDGSLPASTSSRAKLEIDSDPGQRVLRASFKSRLALLDVARRLVLPQENERRRQKKKGKEERAQTHRGISSSSELIEGTLGARPSQNEVKRCGGLKVDLRGGRDKGGKGQRPIKERDRIEGGDHQKFKLNSSSSSKTTSLVSSDCHLPPPSPLPCSTEAPEAVEAPAHPRSSSFPLPIKSLGQRPHLALLLPLLLV